MKNNKVDLSQFDVFVQKPIWLSGKIWDPKLYSAPCTSSLIDCAKTYVDDNNAPLFFVKDSIRVNPFSDITIMSDENDGDVKVIICPNCEKEFEVSVETSDEDILCPHCGYNGKDDDNDENDGDVFEFITEEEFVALSKTKQFNYINKVVITPDELSDEDKEKYESDLFTHLNEYVKGTTSEKVINAINEALAQYE